MEIILRFLSLLFALIVGLFMTQPTYAANVLDKPVLDVPQGVFMTVEQDVLVELKYKAVPMVTTALLLSHRNSIIQTDETLIGKRLMLGSGFKEVETVPKFPYLIRNEHKYQIAVSFHGLIAT